MTRRPRLRVSSSSRAARSRGRPACGSPERSASVQAGHRLFDKQREQVTSIVVTSSPTMSYR
jgi:hypothetical protein